MWQILLFRLFSGFKNASFYSNPGKLKTIFKIISAIGLTAVLALGFITAPNIFTTITLCATVILLLLELRAFVKGQSYNIHLLETLLTPMFTLAMLLTGTSFFTAFVAGIVGNKLFNMPINYVTSGTVFEKIDITDDPTGKTYGLYIFGKKFSIPRIANGYLSMGISIVLSILWVLFHNKLSYSLYNIPFINAYL